MSPSPSTSLENANALGASWAQPLHTLHANRTEYCTNQHSHGQPWRNIVRPLLAYFFKLSPRKYSSQIQFILDHRRIWSSFCPVSFHSAIRAWLFIILGMNKIVHLIVLDEQKHPPVRVKQCYFAKTKIKVHWARDQESRRAYYFRSVIWTLICKWESRPVSRPVWAFHMKLSIHVQATEILVSKKALLLSLLPLASIPVPISSFKRKMYVSVSEFQSYISASSKNLSFCRRKETLFWSSVWEDMNHYLAFEWGQVPSKAFMVLELLFTIKWWFWPKYKHLIITQISAYSYMYLIHDRAIEWPSMHSLFFTWGTWYSWEKDVRK